MIQALIAGGIAGATYGLVALAIVLVYRTTRILNIALGELATLALLMTWTMIESWGWSLTVAGAASGLAVITVTLAFERTVVRRLRGAPPLSGLVATAGLATLLLGVEGKLWTADGLLFTDLLRGNTIELGGVHIDPWELTSSVIALALAVGIGVLLHRTSIGLGIRAMADDLDSARTMGIPVDRASVIVWATASVLVVVAGFLLRPTIGFVAPGLLTGLFLRGLAGAVIGGLGSMSGAFVGGILVGLLEGLAAHLFIGTSFQGSRSLAVLVVVMFVLLARGDRVREAPV